MSSGADKKLIDKLSPLKQYLAMILYMSGRYLKTVHFKSTSRKTQLNSWIPNEHKLL